jgi:hypothetical protein
MRQKFEVHKDIGVGSFLGQLKKLNWLPTPGVLLTFMKKTVIGLVLFVPFRHFKQTPMQVVRHIKLIAHENHK